MSRARAFLRAHAAPIYFGLVFLISWGGGFFVFPAGLPLSSEEFANLGPLAYLAIIAGPSVSGILMIAASDGTAGIRELLARLLQWRVAPVWYGVALVPAVTLSVAALALWLVYPGLRPAIVTGGDASAMLVSAIGPSLMVGFLEEIGWTGFAAPRLRARHSILVTGLGIGVIWGAWHFPLFWEVDSFHGALPFTILLARLFAWLPPFRVLLIAAYERTRSLPVVMLMHAAVSYVSIVLAPSTLQGASLMVALALSVLTMWLLVGLLGHRSSPTLTGAPISRPLAV